MSKKQTRTNANDIFKIDEEDKKCAPSKKYYEGTCFTVESLTKIANAYNKYVKNNPEKIINITPIRKELLKQINDRIPTCNGDQICWLDVEWIKQIKDPEIHNNTFRPKGPQGRFKWLSTTNINEIIAQYESKYKDFHFLGAVPYDFEDLDQLQIGNIMYDHLFEAGFKKLGMVINLDEHWKKGSHWVALFINLETPQIYFFDSYGTRPRKRIAEFVKKTAFWFYKKYKLNGNSNESNSDSDLDQNFMTKTKNKYEKLFDIRYNTIRHQYKNSECGVYSVNFILRLLNVKTFDNICKNITSDDEINELRKEYFRFK